MILGADPEQLMQQKLADKGDRQHNDQWPHTLYDNMTYMYVFKNHLTDKQGDDSHNDQQ